MLSKVLTFSFILILYSQTSVFADDIITDRPDQTESAAVVPSGSFQIETGLLMEYDEVGNFEINHFTVNSTLLRVGVAKNLELRAGIEYLDFKEKNKTTNITTGVKGFGPFMIGAKLEVMEELTFLPQIAVLGHLTLHSTGADDFSPDDLAPDIRLALSHTLTDDFSLGYNFGAEWDGSGSDMITIYTLSLGYSIDDNIGCYGEIFGKMADQMLPEHNINGGFTYLIRSNLQIDAFAGVGINEASTDSFFGIGLSLRIPD